MADEKQKKKLKVGFNLGFRESLGIILCGILFFIGPIVVIEYTKQLNPALTQTYTQSAIESAQGGQVAGISTISQTTIDEKYFTIPLINFKFDTTLSEPASIVFLFGVLLLIGGIILGTSLIVSSQRKMTVPRR
jgi:hypothetical protein